MKQNVLIVESVTWSRDSHGLFDYESKSVNKKIHKPQDPVVLVRQGNDTLLMPDTTEPLPEQFQPLVKFRGNETNWAVESGSEESLWKVVQTSKEEKTPGYKLSEGDVIKLGRMKYKVKELRTWADMQERPAKKTPDTSGEYTTEDIAEEFEEATQKQCRICFSDVCEPGDPLISPCLCAGTMEFIHFQCLKQWIALRMNPQQTSNVMSYYWKSLDCELCKSEYPETISHKGSKLDLMEINKPEYPYVILESTQRDRNQRISVFIISMQNKNCIRLGRGHDSDIRISDISVSRFHAVIKFEQDSFWLEDNASKFGTLIDATTKFTFEEPEEIVLQVGRTVLHCRYS